jgi:hypothetical protein
MALASAISKHRLATPTLRLRLIAWATALGARFSAERRQLDPLCCDVSADDARLKKALRRASGTWGGYQASRPFTHRPPD